jgi:hypothetical protein
MTNAGVDGVLAASSRRRSAAHALKEMDALHAVRDGAASADGLRHERREVERQPAVVVFDGVLV